jgi:hypothetical protein
MVQTKNNGLKTPNVTIKVEEICLVNSSLKYAQKNLKKIEKIYNELNLIDFKQIKKNNGLTQFMYCEIWFIFIDDVLHIQKQLINYFKYDFKDEQQPIKKNEFVTKIRMLIKPISVEILTSSKRLMLPQIKLFVPKSIYDEF